MELTERKDNRLLKNSILIVIALALCAFCWWLSGSQQLADLATFVTKELDEMKGTVLKLTAISSVSSTALTLIPGDVATPLAENLADISDYLILVFGGIWLQKYLFSSMSVIALRFIIPLGLLFNVLPLICDSFKLETHFLYQLRRIGNKIALFGAVIFTVVPATVYITNTIESSYDSTIHQTLTHADKLNLQTEATTKETTDKKKQKETTQEEPKDIVGQVANAISGTVDGVVDWTTGTINAVGGTVSELPSQMIQLLNDLIDSVAILIVVNCLAPLLVFAFLVWLAKLLFGINSAQVEASLGRFKPMGHLVRSRTHAKQDDSDAMISDL